MIAEAGLDIPIFTLDTGRLFPETYDLHRPDRQALRPVHQDVLPGRGRGREDGRPRRRQPLPRQHRGAQALLRGAQDPARCGARSSSSTPGSAACAAARAPRARRSRSPSGTSSPTWSRSTRWRPGTRPRVWDYVRAARRARTTRCTTRASRASAARPARAPSPRARTRAPAAGGGRAPSTASAACTTARPASPGSAAGDRRRTPEAPVNQLDTLEAKSVHILREAYRALGQRLHALVDRQGQHRAAAPGAQGVLRPRADPAGAHRHRLQDAGDDRVPRPAGARVAPQPGRRPEPQGARGEGHLPRRQLRPHPVLPQPQDDGAQAHASTANGRGCAWTTPWAGWWRTRTSRPTPA